MDTSDECSFSLIKSNTKSDENDMPLYPFIKVCSPALLLLKYKSTINNRIALHAFTSAFVKDKSWDEAVNGKTAQERASSSF